MSEISPLFVIEAEKLTLDEHFDEAIQLCLEGIEQYPEYVTAWCILARAFSGKGETENAIKTIAIAIEEHPDSTVLLKLHEQYLNSGETITAEIDKIKTNEQISIPDEEINLSHENLFQKADAQAQKAPKGFLTKYIADKASQNKPLDISAVWGLSSFKFRDTSFLTKERKSNSPTFDFPGIPFLSDEVHENKTFMTDSKAIHPQDNYVPPKWQDNLMEIAKQLDEASKPLPQFNKDSANDNISLPHGIVSETMANIYLQQGAYEAASEAYTELLKRHPEKKDYYTEKLELLKPKLK